MTKKTRGKSKSSGRLEMRDWKIRHDVAGVENAGL